MDECVGNVDLTCRDKTTALHLKGGAIVSIMVASSLGVAIPLVGRRFRLLRTDGNFFFVAKAFAAGVILATGFVHMMPDAQEALTNPCLSEDPWDKFPWNGFIAMMAALLTLVVDFVGTEYIERKHGMHHHHHHGDPVSSGTGRITSAGTVGDVEGGGGADGMAKDGGVKDAEHGGKLDHESCSSESAGHMHIVGMRAHAVSHSHSHADGKHGAAADEPGHSHHAGHQHVASDANPSEVSLRHVVISQVLELGIVAHSVIIGISLGVSESPCTIRPLMAALVFHQFFEGFALGGCISQAGFKYSAAIIMAFFFAVTTPFGIALGIGIASSYNENSPHALIVEGVFDAISAGILIYMALVDLIAADFLSKRLRCDRQLQVLSYLALFGGAGAMSAIAIWA